MPTREQLKKLEERIAAEETKAAQRVAALKAELKEKAGEVAQAERKAQNKKKILIGAMVLEWMASDDAVRDDVMSRMDKYLTRPVDRRVFGWTAKADEKPSSGDTQGVAGHEEGVKDVEVA